MNDEASLLAAIRASPDDDTLRLVYADWLDEHGTTDQQRARSEWIRFTCDYKGRKTRELGERKWVAANAHRLWPQLMGFWSLGSEVRFDKRAVMLRVRRTSTASPTSVRVKAVRGVTSEVIIPFERAYQLAPLAAADEPAADLKLNSAAWAVGWNGDGVQVRRLAFKEFGLLEVYNRIPASDYIGSEAKLVWAPLVLEFLPWLDAGFAAASAALTQWAREHARNPLTGLTEPVA